MTILCATPDALLGFLRQHAQEFRPGSLVTDVCGIKTAVMEAAKALPEGVDYIGSHPMAGTEFAGIEHALPNLFHGSNWIMVPREDSTQEHKDFIRRMAHPRGLSGRAGDHPRAPRCHHRLHQPAHAYCCPFRL